MNIDYKAAGKMMGSYRRKEKISQKELAKAVGISNNYLSNIENGYTIPSLDTELGNLYGAKRYIGQNARLFPARTHQRRYCRKYRRFSKALLKGKAKPYL